MELWDVLDEHGGATGKVIRRGERLSDGEFHLVVSAWIVNDKGQFLLSRRVPEKPFGGLWENTGGAALCGEDSLTAILREVKEELGVSLDRANGRFFKRWTRPGEPFWDIVEVWLFFQNVELADVALQPGETDGVKWAGEEDLEAMFEAGAFLPRSFFPYLQDLYEVARQRKSK